MLFPLAEKLLSPKDAQDVAIRMEEADARFGRSQQKLLLELLQELEGKYLRKAA